MTLLDFFSFEKGEKEQLGKFYQASLISESLNVILPFQFIYLFLVMDRPEWAFIPLIVEGIIIFAMEIPTGMIADRWGRKRSVILGDVLSGLGWLMVPLTAFVDGPWQLVIACFAFALEAVGQTLTSGAEEAWVVDNLEYVDKPDLVDNYYAREKSFGSIGGLISSIAAWMLLLFSQVDILIISLLWIIAAIGQLISALIYATIPEHPVGAFQDEEEEFLAAEAGTLARSLVAFKSLIAIKPLFAMTLIVLITSFATSIDGNALEISMVTKGLNPRELAPLTVILDCLGIFTPIFAIYLARRIGSYRFMAWLLLIAAAVVAILLLKPPLYPVIGIFLILNVLDDLWDPICDAELQAYIPSRMRATVTSIINELSELVGLVAIVGFALILGSESEALRDAVPDLLEAFQGTFEHQKAEVPTTLFDIPLPDAAIVFYTIVGVFAALILLRFPWGKTSRGRPQPELRPEPQSPEISSDSEDTVYSDEDTPLRRRLIAIKEEMDERLDHHNPGEDLSWWIAPDAFQLPPQTIDTLQRGGPPLSKFFDVANDLFYQNDWIKQRLEKRISPNYQRLNRVQQDALPRLIRPDVVCDENWNPKLVELEITVGGRADTSAMASQYGLSKKQSLVQVYARMARDLNARGLNLALLTAPHPFFLDLPDDALSFGSMLRAQGVDIMVLTEKDLPWLRFDGQNLVLCGRGGQRRPIHVFDRFIDIYEIAELQHPGMGAILDAYLAGKVTDINTCKQFLDEKDWMSLFWEPKLGDTWKRGLTEEGDAVLRDMIPRTMIVQTGLELPLATGERVPILELGDLKPEYRRFVIKESGTSTTASGAQSFHVLHQMESEDISELIHSILQSGVEFVLQELVESVRIEFEALDPETDRLMRQKHARLKLSPFYLDGELTDIRLCASNVHYAVNDGDCVVSVVRY